MPNPAKVLLASLLLVTTLLYISLDNTAQVIDVKKDTYTEALKAASQLATLDVIDTSNINKTYDGDRNESSDIPINFEALDKFRGNLYRILENQRSGELGEVSSINVPLAGFVTYDYVLGVTYGEAVDINSILGIFSYEDDSGNLVTVDSYEEYVSLPQNIRDKFNNVRGTYLMPAAYTFYSKAIDVGSDLGDRIWRFTLGNRVYIPDESGEDITYEAVGTTLYRLTIDSMRVEDEEYDISEYLNFLGFSTIKELASYVVMESINEYLNAYSGVGFNQSSEINSASLKFDLARSNYSSGLKSYTSESSTISGPGLFAVIDLYTGTGSNKRMYDRMASFGGSELVATRELTENRNTYGQSGNFGEDTGGGLHPGNPGEPGGSGGGSGDDPGTVIDPEDLTSHIIYLRYDANGGTGSMEDDSARVNIGSQNNFSVKANKFTPPFGLIFYSWNTMDDGSGIDYKPGSLCMIGDDLTLYAKWGEKAKPKYTISYFDGSSLINSQVVTQGTELEIPAGQTKAGLIFLGWTDQPTGKTVRYQVGDKVEVTVNMRLYGMWDTADELTIYAASVSAQYDALPHEVTVVKSIDAASVQVSYVKEPSSATGIPIPVAKPIDVGTYTANITAIYGYKEATAKVKVIITKRTLLISTESITITDEELASRPGGKLTGGAVQVDGLVAGQSLTSRTKGELTAIGTCENGYELDWSSASGTTALESNYKVQVSSLGRLTVTKSNRGRLKLNLLIFGISDKKLLPSGLYARWVESWDRPSEHPGDTEQTGVISKVSTITEDKDRNCLTVTYDIAKVPETVGRDELILRLQNADIDGYYIGGGSSVQLRCNITGTDNEETLTYTYFPYYSVYATVESTTIPHGTTFEYILTVTNASTHEITFQLDPDFFNKNITRTEAFYRTTMDPSWHLLYELTSEERAEYEAAGAGDLLTRKSHFSFRNDIGQDLEAGNNAVIKLIISCSAIGTRSLTPKITIDGKVYTGNTLDLIMS